MSDDDVDEVADSTAEVKDPSNPAVLDKYKRAALIAHSCILHLTALALPSSSPLSLCEAGDRFIEDEVKKAYTRDKKLEKGIAFPTCISVNHCVGHFSPLTTTPATPLNPGDVVKLDVAVHIDGYIAPVTHTVLIPSPSPPPTSPTPPHPRLADLFAALTTANDAVLRCMRAGVKNTVVTDIIGRVAREYKVQLVQGVLSHNMERFVLDGPRVILMKQGGGAGAGGGGEEKKDDSRVEEVEFKINEIYAVDIILSSGDGKPKPLDECTVYKRNTQSSYQLKMKVSRTFLSDVDKRSPLFPFTLRWFDESKAKFAVRECKQHDLVYSYPVMVEKEGEVVVQCKMAVWISERGAVKLSGMTVEGGVGVGKTEVKVTDEEIKKLLNQSVLLPEKKAGVTGGGGAAAAAGIAELSAAEKARKAKKNAKKKAAKKAAGGETAAAEDGGKADDKEDGE